MVLKLMKERNKLTSGCASKRSIYSQMLLCV